VQPAEFYKTQQDIYPGINTSPRLAKVARLARKYASGARSLLDIGCGDGTFAAELRHLLGAQEAVGVEVSSAAAEAANKRGVAAQVVDIDKGCLPFGDASFDLVYCGEVIEHVYDPDHLLDEVDRLLAPTGVAIVDTPNLASLVNRVSLLLGYQPFLTDVSLRHNVGKLQRRDPGGGGHIRVFTKRALEELLRLHGFQILELTGARALEPAYLSPPLYLDLLDTVLSWVPTMPMVLIVAVRKGQVETRQ
jgi:SAM-dependent methyltransferase